MTEAAERVEQELLRDLATLSDRLSYDEEFGGDLYRALTNNRWRREGRDEGHVSLSWSRAEELVNEVRRRAGAEPLALAQTGGEGEVSSSVQEELGRLGWSFEPLDTSAHDEAHLGRPESPPPPDQGERMAPVEDSGRWEREAHEAADRWREEHGETGRRTTR